MPTAGQTAQLDSWQYVGPLPSGWSKRRSPYIEYKKNTFKYYVMEMVYIIVFLILLFLSSKTKVPSIIWYIFIPIGILGWVYVAHKSKTHWLNYIEKSVKCTASNDTSVECQDQKQARDRYQSGQTGLSVSKDNRDWALKRGKYAEQKI